MPDTLLPSHGPTTESLIRDLERLRDVLCINCGTQVGPLESLMSIAMGFRNAPPCFPCLTLLLKVDLNGFRDSLLAHIRSRDCYLGA